MAAIIRSLDFVSKISNKSNVIAITAVRNAAYWNKDYKPGKFPQTKEERELAAKKYNLLPEEYKPYADDGQGFGDYPKLPNISVETRDPYYAYDFPEHKRNLHEPIHAEIDMYGEDRIGSAEPLRYPMRVYWGAFLGVLTGCFALYYWLDDKRMFRPVIPKQLPGQGKVHYTFERNE